MDTPTAASRTPTPTHQAALPPDAVEAFRLALDAYGGALTANFASLTVAQPEAQLTSPVQVLMGAAAAALGHHDLVCRAEMRVEGLAGRPDLGIDLAGLPVGSVELKAPGKGADPARFSDRRDREQWGRFRALPNLVYTDGRDWTLFRDGEIAVSVGLSASPTHLAGRSFTTDDAGELLALLAAFLGWQPRVVATPAGLATALAPLARLLRDEVLADVRAGGALEILAADWRRVLFLDSTSEEFADAYAQTFTYALLLAKLEGAASPLRADDAVTALGSGHGLLGEVLRFLDQHAAREVVELPVALLERVIDAIDVARLAASKRDPWLYFYEDFLAAYDPKQRNERGVFYTPQPVVDAQVRLVEHVLRDRLGIEDGYADPEVTVLDPAVGRGTYPLTLFERTLRSVEEESGPGVLAEVATRLAHNVHAFELLVGPYAVSHLRVGQALAGAGATLPEGGLRVYLTDTLSAPSEEAGQRQRTLFSRELSKEQERASEVKAIAPVTVCIGNPPYDRDESRADDRHRRGGIVRHGAANINGGTPLFDAFTRPVREAGQGVHLKTIYNDYVYFWRWAIWKTCEQPSAGHGAAVVSFITPSSFLDGPGFAGMRQVLRQRFDGIWVIDLGGEGRGASPDENVFDIRTPVCITVAFRKARTRAKRADAKPCPVFYRRIDGDRQAKFAGLDTLLQLSQEQGWQRVSGEELGPFVPEAAGAFASWPEITDLFPWQQPGALHFRPWPIAESRELAQRRWRTLRTLPAEARAEALRESRDRKANKVQRGLFSRAPLPTIAELSAEDEPEEISPYAFRSLDRHVCLADARVADSIRPELWDVRSDAQVYLTTLRTKQLGAGPSVLAAAHVPDLHHFQGGCRVLPLWRDAAATRPNVNAGALAVLSSRLGGPVGAPDLLAYVYAIAGTGAYTDRFHEQLAGPGYARIPLTADRELFDDAVQFGRELLWWHTYGERTLNATATGQPLLRRFPKALTAKALTAVSTAAERYPEDFAYDERTQILRVGDGTFGPVAPEVWEFEVSGYKVIQRWLSYRMRKRAGKASSPLDELRPTNWAFTGELLQLLAVVESSVSLTPRAADLLGRIVEGPVITVADLPAPTDAEHKKPARPSATPELAFDAAE